MSAAPAVSLLISSGSSADELLATLFDVVHTFDGTDYETLLLVADRPAVAPVLAALDGDLRCLDVPGANAEQVVAAGLAAARGATVLMLSAGELVDVDALARLNASLPTEPQQCQPIGCRRDPEALLRAQARSVLHQHEAVLAAFEEAAELTDALGNRRAAVAIAAAAGDVGWHNHPGRYSSPRLEALLLRLGRFRVAEPQPARRQRVSGGSVQRVLHVLTEGYPVGGHTRLAWRWMEADSSRQHSVVLTRQRGPLPEQLRTAAESSGGQLFQIDDPVGDVFAQARMLRALAADADVVILHIHPFDVVPLLAFADPAGRPPIGFLNHADHAFFLGYGISELFIQVRESARGFTGDRRGLTAERLAVLPLPLDGRVRTLDRAAAKRELGLPAEATLLVTVGQPHKYARVDDASFLDLVLPVLMARPDVQLIAVGPQQSDEWQAAYEATGGRVHALGIQPEVSRFYQAADVYLDSFPYGSATALTEAALLGAPVLAYAPHRDEAPVIYADLPGTSDALVRRARTPEEFSTELTDLLDHPEQREQAGTALAAGLAARVAGTDWQDELDVIYQRLLDSDPAATEPAAALERRTRLADELLVRVATMSNDTVGVAEASRRHGVDLALLTEAFAKLGLDPYTA
jgi:hypothetical protein